MLIDTVGAKSRLKERLQKYLEDKSLERYKKNLNHLWLTKSSKLKLIGDYDGKTTQFVELLNFYRHLSITAFGNQIGS